MFRMTAPNSSHKKWNLWYPVKMQKSPIRSLCKSKWKEMVSFNFNSKRELLTKRQIKRCTVTVISTLATAQLHR